MISLPLSKFIYYINTIRKHTQTHIVICTTLFDIFNSYLKILSDSHSSIAYYMFYSFLLHFQNHHSWCPSMCKVYYSFLCHKSFWNESPRNILSDYNKVNLLSIWFIHSIDVCVCVYACVNLNILVDMLHCLCICENWTWIHILRMIENILYRIHISTYVYRCFISLFLWIWNG